METIRRRSACFSARMSLEELFIYQYIPHYYVTPARFSIHITAPLERKRERIEAQCINVSLNKFERVFPYSR